MAKRTDTIHQDDIVYSRNDRRRLARIILVTRGAQPTATLARLADGKRVYHVPLSHLQRLSEMEFARAISRDVVG